MATSYVRMKGLDTTLAKLRALPAALSGDKGGPVRAALFKAGSIIKKQAISNAPIGKGTPMPGLLRRSIYMYRDRNPKRFGANERYYIAVRGNRKKGVGKLFGVRTALAYYWHFVEFGTVKQRPQRYLTRAFNANAQRAVTEFENELRRTVGGAVRKLGGRL